MGLTGDVPEKFAQKIIEKHNIEIPFNLKELALLYAKVKFTNIPIEGISGVSLDLKVPGLKPKIVVNTNQSLTRQKFTLAHELGHVIIPWHIRRFIHDVDGYIYDSAEKEADKFASELLIPSYWVNEVYLFNATLADKMKFIVDEAGVSPIAALIKISKLFPSNIYYISEKNNIIQRLGKTIASEYYLNLPEKGDPYNNFKFKYIDEYSRCNIGGINYHWYKLMESIKIYKTDNRNWDTILDAILNDVYNLDDRAKKRKSILAIISAADSKAFHLPNYNLDTLISMSIKKFERPGYEEFVLHPDFEVFLKNRCCFHIDNKEKKAKTSN